MNYFFKIKIELSYIIIYYYDIVDIDQEIHVLRHQRTATDHS